MADNMQYVKTSVGQIAINDLPVVKNESFTIKFSKSMLFFGIIILIVLIYYISVNWTCNKIDHTKVVIESMCNKIHTSVQSTSMDLYHLDQTIILENVVIITADNNMINIDTSTTDDDKINPFVKVFQKGSGALYHIDFQTTLDIKEIVLISPPDDFIPRISIDLFGTDSTKVWTYTGNLRDRRDNTIRITKLKMDISKPVPEDIMELADLDPNRKIVINERELAISLRESGDEYVSH